MPDHTERTRDSIINAIHTHQRRLDQIASKIIKAELPSLSEPLAEVEKEASAFITTVRSYQ